MKPLPSDGTFIFPVEDVRAAREDRGLQRRHAEIVQAIAAENRTASVRTAAARWRGSTSRAPWRRGSTCAGAQGRLPGAPSTARSSLLPRRGLMAVADVSDNSACPGARHRAGCRHRGRVRTRSVTLRQLFFRLGGRRAGARTPTTLQGHLSAHVGGATPGDVPRPDRLDAWIHRAGLLEDAEAARGGYTTSSASTATAGQDVSLYLAVEKRAIASQLEAWFGELGIPMLPLGGYTSQSFVDDVRRDAALGQRPTPCCMYAGDFDPPARTSTATSSALGLLRRGDARRPQRRAGRALRPAAPDRQGDRLPRARCSSPGMVG